MKYVIGLLVIFAGFLLLRYLNLLGQPLYLDEGLYVYWAQMFSKDPRYAYISLLDGKTPLFMWLIAAVDSLFHNFLFTGRIISVFSGLVSVMCWFLIVRKYTEKRNALIFLLIFSVMPYSILIERMAFVDSMLGALASIALVFFIYSRDFIYKQKIFLLYFLFILLSGISLGLAYMTKTSARLFFILQILIGIIWIIEYIAKKKIRGLLFAISGLLLLSAIYNEVISYMRVGAHRLWPSIILKENQLVYSFPDIIKNFNKISESIYIQNFPLMFQYILIYLGPIFLLAILGIIIIMQTNKKLIWLAIYAVVIYAGIFLSGKVIASRYFYMAVPVTVALAALGASAVWDFKKRILRAFLIIIWLMLFFQSILMVAIPLHAIYAYDDQNYFVSSELSALGLQEIIKTVSSNSGQTIVGVSGIWGINEGVGALLSEKGVEVVLINNWWQKFDKNYLGECEKDQKLIGEICYKININQIIESKKQNKYLYLSRDNENIQLLRDFGLVKEENEFIRPLSGQKTYLIKL